MQILGIAVLSALYYNKRYVILISHYSMLSSTNEFRKHYKCLIINISDKQCFQKLISVSNILDSTKLEDSNIH